MSAADSHQAFSGGRPQLLNAGGELNCILLPVAGCVNASEVAWRQRRGADEGLP